MNSLCLLQCPRVPSVQLAGPAGGHPPHRPIPDRLHADPVDAALHPSGRLHHHRGTRRAGSCRWGGEARSGFAASGQRLRGQFHPGGDLVCHICGFLPREIIPTIINWAPSPSQAAHLLLNYGYKHLALEQAVKDSRSTLPHSGELMRAD